MPCRYQVAHPTTHDEADDDEADHVSSDHAIAHAISHANTHHLPAIDVTADYAGSDVVPDSAYVG